MDGELCNSLEKGRYISMENNCNPCFLGDSIAGSSITVPASQYVAGMPGKVVIPEDEITANDDLNSLNSHFDTTEDYWTVHNG